MSIITVTDIAGTSGSTTIDSADFTKVIAAWFGDSPETIDESIREQFFDLAEIIESGQVFTDEDAGELCRFLALDITDGEEDDQ